MRKQGLIYHFEWGKTHGEVKIAFNKWLWIAAVLIQPLGSALIVVGLAGIIFTLQPVVSTEVSYRWSQLTGSNQQTRLTDQQFLVQVRAEDDQKEKVKNLAVEWGIQNTHFSIYIPKINARAPIIENVNPNDQNEYIQALSHGVAQASGSVFPGMQGATFLFAHSSSAPWDSIKYNTVFYLLRELNPTKEGPLGGGGSTNKGDEIYVFFLDKVHKYRVTEKRIVEPDDISWLVDAKQGSERLILQTCWPPGTTLKRLIIVAEPE